MAVKTIRAGIALDGEKEFRQAITGINSDMKLLKAQSNLLKEQFAGQQNTMEALTAKHKLLSDTLEANKAKEAAVVKGLENARKAYEKVGSGLEDLKQKYEAEKQKLEEMKQASDTSSEAMTAQEKAVRELSSAISVGERNYTTAGNRVRYWTTQQVNAQTELARTNNALKENEQYLEEARNATDKCATSINEYGQHAERAEEETSNLGSVLEGTLGAAAIEKTAEKLTELGKAALNMAMDTESASSKLQAATGLSDSAMEGYKSTLEDLYKNNYGESMDELATTMSIIQQNMGNLDPSKMETITEDATTLSDTFDMDLSETIRGVSGLMTNMGTDAETAFDLMAKGAQNGLNKSDEFGDNLAEYSQIWGQAGFSAKQMFAILQNGLDSGAYNLDKINDFVKEFSISLSDGKMQASLSSFSDNTKTLFAEYKNGGASAEQVFKSVISDLAGMKNKQEALTIASNTWSSLGEDNAMSVITSLNNVNDTYTDVQGTMDEMKQTRYDNLKSEFESLGRTIELEFGEKLSGMLPEIETGLKLVADNLDVVLVAVAGLGTAAAADLFFKAEFFKAAVAGVKGIATALKAAKTEQAAFNIAAEANPWGLVALAIGGAVAAITAYSLASGKAETAEDKLKKKLKESNDELKENKKTRTDAMSSVEEEYGGYDILIKRLESLRAVEEKSTAQKQEMASIVKQLAEKYPELSKAYDESTGSLKLSNSELEKYADNTKKAALAAAATENITSVAKDLYTADKNLTEAKEQQTEAYKKYNDALKDPAQALNVNTMARLKQSYEDATGQVGEYQSSYDSLNREYYKTTELAYKYTDATEETGDASSDTASTVKKSADTMSTAATELASTVKESMTSASDAFSAFDGGTKISKAKMIKNLDSQVSGLKQWASDLKKLSKRSGAGMTQELYKYLADLGPSGANYVHTFATMSDKELKSAAKKWKKTSSSLPNSISDGIASGYDDISKSGKKAATKATDAVNTGIKSKKKATGDAFSDLVGNAVPVASEAGKKLGKTLPDSVASGAKSKKSAVKNAMQDLVKANISISGYTQAGQKLMGAMSAGMQKQKAQISGASASLALGAAGAAGANKLSFVNVGGYLAAGVISGMLSKDPEIKAAARKIISDAEKAALKEGDIHSPSRKWKEKVGKMMAEGLALGITEGTGKAKKSSTELAKAVLKEAKKWIDGQEKNNKTSAANQAYYWERLKKDAKKKGGEYYKEVAEKAEAYEEKLAKFQYIAQKQRISEIGTGSSAAINKQIKSWQAQISNAKKYGETYYKTVKKYADAAISSLKETLTSRKENAVSGGALDAYKTYYDVSAQAEVQYWDKVRKTAGLSRAQQLEADKNYYDAVENYQEELTTAQEDYADTVKDINDDLTSSVSDLTDAYTESVQSSKEAIAGAYDLFDAFTSESDSGEQLLYNLKSQVAGYAEWDKTVAALTDRFNDLGLSSDLLDDLVAKGPEAVASLMAINDLGDTDLSEYSTLYTQKMAIAEDEAVKQNEALRKTTEEQIQTLEDTAQKQIDAATQTLTDALEALNEPMSSALSKLASNSASWSESTIITYVKGLKTTVDKKETWTDVKTSTAKALKSMVKSAVNSSETSVAQSGTTLGGNVLDGILEGLLDNGKIKGGASSFIKKLTTYVKKEAGINSPSRLFKKEVGKYLAEGTGDGLTENTDYVVDSGKAMLAKLTDAMQGTNTITSSLDIIPTTAALDNLIATATVDTPVVNVNTSDMTNMMGAMLTMMQQYLPDMANTQVVMDTGKLVGEITTPISQALAASSRRKRT